MEESDSYITLSGSGEGIFKDKGSKFLAFAHPVTDEDEIAKLLSAYRKKYYDARHHCYAWMLGANKKHFRANDDGEPSGTAGKPILNQILSAGITDVLVVVVRYFGGVKLGTSGLINAYKQSAMEAISHAPKVQKTVNEDITARFPYHLLNEVMRVCKEEGLVPELQYEAEHIRFTCLVRKSCAKKFAQKISSIYGVELT
ncbi:MAG TPA: YigZ family protein [Bacteroidales bacterium]|nr:YigZ family protein [Bacteroidales bacterium]